jgi:hypothetical protein
MERLEVLAQGREGQLQGDKIGIEGKLYEFLQGGSIELCLEFLNDVPALPAGLLIVSNHTLWVLSSA